MQTNQNKPSAGNTIGIMALGAIIMGIGLVGGIGIGNVISPKDKAHAPEHGTGHDEAAEASHGEPGEPETVAPVAPLVPKIKLAAWGSPMPTSMMTSDCLACHQVAFKVVGPAYNHVADKYKDDPKQVSKLARKIIQGGVGVWGEIPMAPHPQHTMDQAVEMVSWILGQTTEPPAAEDTAEETGEAAPAES